MRDSREICLLSGGGDNELREGVSGRLGADLDFASRKE